MSEFEQQRAEVKILAAEETERVPETGAAQSVQDAEAELPSDVLAKLWHPEFLERLARSYWRFLSRTFLGLVRIVYEPEARIVVLLSRRLPLLSFHKPEYETSSDEGIVTWRIREGLLVASEGEGEGFLRISVWRCGPTRVRLRVEVRNFYPWMRGRGRFARLGTWIYSQTQLRIHVIVCNAFLRSLGRLDFPPSRVGSLRAEINPADEGG